MKKYKGGKREQEEDSPVQQQQHVAVNPLMVYETQRSLIQDDVKATHQVFNPREPFDDNAVIMHQFGFKKRTTAASRRGKPSKNKEHGPLFKVLCCCCYFGNKYLNIGFGWFIMGSIIAMLLGVAYLKLDENVFFYQSLYSLEEVDYYSILNVTRDAQAGDLRRAHRKAVIRWHPDRNPNCGDECVKMMALVSEAYSVLANPEARAFHDKYHVKPPEKMMRAAKETQHATNRKHRGKR
jgi:hypothetical protein